MIRECLWIDCDLLGEIIAIMRPENFTHARRTHLPEFIYWSSKRLRTQTHCNMENELNCFEGKSLFVTHFVVHGAAHHRRPVELKPKEKKVTAAGGESGEPPQVQLCNCQKNVRAVLL